MMAGRYDAEGAEAESEPGSRGRVLRNRVGVTSVREIERWESEALLAATQATIDATRVDQRFTADDIREMHRRWLGEIYAWAGDYRQVNIAKGEFMFAAAGQVPRLMHEFERGPLREYTPCRFDAIDTQAAALAVVHAEFDPDSPFSRRERTMR
jgi:cell filamentation protein